MKGIVSTPDSLTSTKTRRVYPFVFIANDVELQKKADILFKQSLEQVNHRVLHENYLECIKNNEFTKEELSHWIDGIPYQMKAGVELDHSQLIVNTAGTSVRSDKLASEIIAKRESEIASKDSTIAQLNRRLSNQMPSGQIEAEIRAQHPELQTIDLASGITSNGDTTRGIVLVHTQPTLAKDQKAQLQRWLVARTGIAEARVM